MAKQNSILKYAKDFSPLLDERSLPDTSWVNARITNLIAQIKVKRLYHFSMIGTANGENGYFGKTSDYNANPSTGFPTTNKNNNGLSNGVTDPYSIINDCTVKRIRITFGQACIKPKGTIGINPKIRVALYKVTMVSKSLISNNDILFTISEGTIGNNQQLKNLYATGVISELNLPLAAGDSIGMEFISVSTDNTTIHGIGRAIAVLETEE